LGQGDVINYNVALLILIGDVIAYNASSWFYRSSKSINPTGNCCNYDSLFNEG